LFPKRLSPLPSRKIDKHILAEIFRYILISHLTIYEANNTPSVSAIYLRERLTIFGGCLGR